MPHLHRLEDPHLASDPTRAGTSSGSLAALGLATLLASLGVSIANVALPTLSEVFAAPLNRVQWVVVAYLLSLTVSIVGVGRAGDIVGRRRVLLISLGLFTSASVLCALSTSLAMLIGARALQGAAGAGLVTLTLALVRESVPAERTGRVMGTLGTMSALGTMLGPALGGSLISVAGWNSIFWFIVPLGSANFLLVHRCLPADAHAKRGGASGPDGVSAREAGTPGRFDYRGTVLLGAGLAAYALAVTVGGGSPGWANTGLLFGAAVAAALFLVHESRVEFPLVRLEVVHRPALTERLTLNTLVATVLMSTLVVGPFFLSRALGLSDAAVGLVMAVGPAISALSGVPAGRAVDAFGSSSSTTVGLAGIAVGAAALGLLPQAFGTAGYIAALVLITPGYQLFQAANNTAVMTEASANEHGVISGLLNLSRNIGLITGASLVGTVFALATGTAEVVTASAEAVATGMRVTFLGAAGVVGVAVGWRVMRGALRIPEHHDVS